MSFVHRLFFKQILVKKCSIDRKFKTFTASANAKPPPSKRMTLQDMFLWTNFQSNKDGTGPAGFLSVNKSHDYLP